MDKEWLALPTGTCLKGTALTTPPKPGPAPGGGGGRGGGEDCTKGQFSRRKLITRTFFPSEGRKRALFTPFPCVDTAPGGLVSGEP